MTLEANWTPPNFTIKQNTYFRLLKGKCYYQM